MTKFRTPGHLPLLKGWIVYGVLAFASTSALANEDARFAEIEKANAPLMMLASKLASPADGASKEWKAGLVQSYEAVYGDIKKVPVGWAALVRRALTCQVNVHLDCTRSSLEAIDKQGGIAKFPLGRLIEVSRFGVEKTTLMERLTKAPDTTKAKTVLPAPTDDARLNKAAAPQEPPADAAQAAQATSEADDKQDQASSPDAVKTTDEGRAEEAALIAPAEKKMAAERPPSGMTEAPLMLKAVARQTEESGMSWYIAAFISVCALLLLGVAYYLYRRMNAALQEKAEAKQLANAAEHEKIHAEAEKAAAEQALRSAEDLRQAEVRRVEAELKAADALRQAEQERATEKLREEQARRETELKAAETLRQAEQEKYEAEARRAAEEVAAANQAKAQAEADSAEKLRQAEQQRMDEIAFLTQEIRALEEARKAERASADESLRLANQAKAEAAQTAEKAKLEAEESLRLAEQMRAAGDAKASGAAQRAQELQQALDMASHLLDQKTAEAAQAKQQVESLKEAEAQRIAEEAQQRAELARLAEESRLAEENRVLEERRRLEEDERLEEERRAEEARHPVNQVYQASRRLLYAMHDAQQDVSPFLDFLGKTRETPALTGQMSVVQSWHHAIQESREDLLDTFDRNGWQYELIGGKAAATIGESMERLMNHAAFFTALLHVKKQQDSAVYHWSQLLPSALLQMYWTHQTNGYAIDIKALPMPDLHIAKAPITLKDSVSNPRDFFANAVRQAVRKETSAS